MRLLAIACCIAGLAACAYNKGTVVLLPDKEGRQTSVVVNQRDEEVVLDQPYAASRQTIFGQEKYTSSPQEVEAVFGKALGAQPGLPARYTLYFVEGKNEFTDESKLVVDNVLREIARRPEVDVVVIGHADAVGSNEDNDKLSRERAEVVGTALIGLGVPAKNIVTIGRGKREPIVPTPDGVAEPRNRRVEIIVR
jgi:outer membrane protein OmpA-like peptidoglycan-associated protein